MGRPKYVARMRLPGFARENVGPAVHADDEHAVGLHREIAAAGGEVQGMSLPPALDVEADRPSRLVIHAGIHRESQASGLRAERLGETVEASDRPAASLDDEREPVLPRRVAANREARPFERPRGAGRGRLPLAAPREQEQEDEYPKANSHHR
jgi:hypothetical protein